MAERRNKTQRDMLLSMGLIVVVVLLYVGIYGNFSFAPGGPTGGQVIPVDVQGGFSRAASVVRFPVIVPKGIPATWQPNSFTTTPPTADATQPARAQGGWITTDGSYVTLVQSVGAATAVLVAVNGTSNPTSGSVPAGGATWTITQGRRTQVAWFRTSGNVTFVITGSATPADFQQVAQALAAGTIG